MTDRAFRTGGGGREHKVGSGRRKAAGGERWKKQEGREEPRDDLTNSLEKAFRSERGGLNQKAATPKNVWEKKTLWGKARKKEV